uniref:Uncharacterized protein LOC102810035 n=1 Tax=Saccoglossus kowalevskii TaxID=10224 RepID=A0ABM0MUB5_SACKO|nr:PREDICTED: uncharacterized protein LOC102810035 [Saccoglossus kowalevskii]
MTLKLLFLWILNTLFIGSVTAMAFRTVPLHGGNTSNPAISSTCALCRPRYSLDGGSCYDPVKEICCDGKIYNIERTPSLRCCGDTPYMPDTHSCCGPLTTDQYRIITSSSEICCSDSEGVAWVHSVIGKGRVMCCGGKAFDSDKKICCKGHLHMNTSSSRCCGHRTYSSETHMCCNKKIIRIRNGRAHCCASTVYNPPREACCNGQVVIGHNKENVSNDETCQDLSQRTVASLPERLDLPCGNDTYDPLHELCCDGVPHYMDAGDTERVSCCGRQTFRPETDLCCNGVVFLGSDELDITNRRCCGIQTILVYNSKLQMCCDEQIYNKHSSGCDGLTKDIFVSIGGLDYNGCGTSMDNSCRTIAYAWLLLKYGDTLKIDGRNSENNPYKVCASFDGFGLTCNKSITIQGTNSPAYISGGNRCNVFSFYGIPSTKPISVTLSGLTFVNISALTYDNGAISAIGVNLHVFDCVFSNTQDGYAVWYEPGSVILNANMCLKINISRFLNNFGGLRIVLPKSNSSNNSTVSVMVSNTFFQDNTRYGSLVLTNIGSVNLTVEATKVQISRSANELGGALHLGPLQTDGPMPTQTPSLQDNMFQEMDSNDDGYVSVIKETHNMEIDYNIRSYIFFNDCIFNHNNAREMGGAIYADTPDFSELIFSNMSILHNSVSNTFKTGKGGGIYLNGGHVTFLNVTMVDNNATFLGGSVYNDIDTKILEIIDSSFETRVQGDQSSSQNGELLFSISNIIDISNSSFIVTSASLTNITAVFISAKLNYTIDSETLIRCDSGYNIAIDSVCKNGGTISSFNCIPCSKSTYSFDHGYSSGWEVYPIDCLPCPKGGDCEHAHVHARPGQWGYQDNTSLISKAIFQPCPSGYCCDNHDQHECPSFNSCPRNRTGILCRRCKDEYYNVLGSTACVHISDCSKEQAIWQIILLILGVLLFYLFLLFKSELTEFIYQTYIMKIKSEKKNDSDDDGGDISPSHSSEPSIKNDEYKRPWLREHGLPWQSSDDYVKIVFLFYQVVDLLIVEDTSFPRSHISSVQIFVVKLFNFQMVPPFLTTCVDNNSKVFLNSWQYELLLFLWVIVGSKYVFGSVVCRECSIRCTKCPRKVSRFNSRITKAYMQILILGYVVLLKRLLKRIHTTEINNKPETTYDPTVESWEWVWYTSVVYVFTALFPFCVVVSLGAYLLEKKYIGVSQYLLACIFPLPFIPVWLYCYYCAHGKTSKDYIKMDDNGHSYPILEVLQSPFKVGSRYWESVFLFTKLVLVWCNVYILNAFLQSLVMRIGTQYTPVI